MYISINSIHVHFHLAVYIMRIFRGGGWEGGELKIEAQ